MSDNLTPLARSALMARVRGTGNVSTELTVQHILRSRRIWGWEKHPSDLPCKPDFYFRKAQLALFVDGCFWHGCPSCCRNVPKTRSRFWSDKLRANRCRDNRTRRHLRKLGICVMRVWEHQVLHLSWVSRLSTRLSTRGSTSNRSVETSPHRRPKQSPGCQDVRLP